VLTLAGVNYDALPKHGVPPWGETHLNLRSSNSDTHDPIDLPACSTYDNALNGSLSRAGSSERYA
jgi:hypothetical protein